MALSSADKARLAEKLIDLANILLSGAALGQAFVEKQFNVSLAVCAVGLFVGLWALAIWILRGR